MGVRSRLSRKGMWERYGRGGELRQAAIKEGLKKISLGYMLTLTPD